MEITTITTAAMSGALTAALLPIGAVLCALHGVSKQVVPSVVESLGNATDRRFGRTRGGYRPTDVLRTCEPCSAG